MIKQALSTENTVLINHTKISQEKQNTLITTSEIVLSFPSFFLQFIHRAKKCWFQVLSSITRFCLPVHPSCFWLGLSVCHWHCRKTKGPDFHETWWMGVVWTEKKTDRSSFGQKFTCTFKEYVYHGSLDLTYIVFLTMQIWSHFQKNL